MPEACSECTRSGFAAWPEVYVLAFLLALAIATLLVRSSLRGDWIGKLFAGAASLVLVASMSLLGVGLWRGLEVNFEGGVAACGTTLGATRKVYQQGEVHAVCRQQARERLAKLRASSEVSFGAAAVLIIAAAGYLAAERRRGNASLPQ
jgi:hypothetical protein